MLLRQVEKSVAGVLWTDLSFRRRWHRHESPKALAARQRIRAACSRSHIAGGKRCQKSLVAAFAARYATSAMPNHWERQFATAPTVKKCLARHSRWMSSFQRRVWRGRDKVSRPMRTKVRAGNRFRESSAEIVGHHLRPKRRRCREQ